MSQRQGVNVSELIDSTKFSSFQVRIIVLCGVIAILDGFDTQAIAFVAPVIANLWGMDVSAFGPVFGAGLLGLTIGALCFGPIADRFGRKNVIIISILIFGIFSILTVNATTVGSLFLYRFLTGVGLGGAMPNIIAMTAEFSPIRIRNTMITVMFCGFPLGAVLGGLVSAKMIPVLGWESVFYLGGILPLILIPVIMKALPESIRFLVSQGKQPERIAGILNRINPTEKCTDQDSYYLPEEKLTGFSVKHLFTNGQAKATLLLWVVFFMNLLILYFLINWLPSLLQSAGFPIEKAIISIVLLNLGGVVGGILISRRLDKKDPYRILTVTFILAALFVGIIGFVGKSILLIMILVFFSGFFVVGSQFCINALAASVYPTAVRSTGVGWALGIGRIGSIVGPVIGGIILSLKWSMMAIFLASAVPALIAAGAIYLLNGLKHKPPVTPANPNVDVQST
jgi:AAHS family 4-hydroxybenzoate transporter-like MFS transporter